MRVQFGIDAAARKRGEQVDVAWDSELAINGHMLLVGMSGAGKTYTLKKILRQMQETSARPPRVHVFDVHGDLHMPGASSVRFSESTQYGLNPLIINDDPHFGGVRKRIQSFLATINRTSRALGGKQEAVLRHILQDLYAANGFYADNPRSWPLDDGVERRYAKKYPTLDDVLRYSRHKLKTLYTGSDQAAMAALEKLNKKAQSLNGKALQAKRFDAPEGIESDIDKLSEECIRVYSEYVQNIKTGRELDDVIKYDSRDVLKSVVERIENLCGIGVFKAMPPPFDPRNPVWHYDLTALGLDERKLFVLFRLEELFREALHRGEQPGISDVLLLDEIHIFADEDPENIINSIAKEARKFGQALIGAGQTPTQFPEQLIASVATKVILGIDEMYWDGAARKLGIDRKALEWIRPQQTLLVQLKQRAQTRSSFQWTVIQ